jgi:hypothetical protein
MFAGPVTNPTELASLTNRLAGGASEGTFKAVLTNNAQGTPTAFNIMNSAEYTILSFLLEPPPPPAQSGQE